MTSTSQLSAPDDDTINFMPEADPPAAAGSDPRVPWKILIVDDEEMVRSISRTILEEVEFDQRPLEILEAKTGAESIELMERHPDVAVILMDVVMETDTAGLDAIRAIRHQLGNRFVRIILRTGQPGHAPERQVIVDYDINDYKEKTELTMQKLVTAVIAGLRSYRDLQTIEQSRLGLEKVIEATRGLFEQQSLAKLSQGVLEQLNILLNMSETQAHVSSGGLAAMRDTTKADHPLIVVAGTGKYEQHIGTPLESALADHDRTRLMTLPQKHWGMEGDSYLGRFTTSTGSDNYVFVEAQPGKQAIASRMLEVFSTNIGLAIDNAALQEELAATQNELTCTLSQLVESRSHETGRHVLRVGALAYHMGKLLELDERECQLLRLSAPMHDIGKIAIPDAILNKPGRLSEPEMIVMKEHARIGHGILADSRRPTLRSASIIAMQHHERWDGAGYPNGLKGDEIHLHGRIVGLVDVFDALSHPRCYKQPWPLDKIYAYLQEQSGRQFDPALVDLFLAHVDEFESIWNKYRDPFPEETTVDPNQI